MTADKIAVVTGAGSGIGRAIATELARRGHVVVATDLDLDAARATSADTALRLDVTDPEQAATVADKVTSAYGGLDVWVSNAGISKMQPFLDVSPADLRTTLAVNLEGVFVCGQAAARAMTGRGTRGTIVNVASMAGKQGRVPFLADYVAAKFGVVGLTQAMAFELAPHGITVNAVCPGYVATPMQERELGWEAALRGVTPEQVRQLWIDDTPLGRLETPQDVARAVAFLVSPDAAFITGEALAVNGGAFMDLSPPSPTGAPMDITQASTASASSASSAAAADADLAQFGYKQQLNRTIGPYTSFALAFSMISVTTTVFTLFAQPFQALGGVAIWLWLPVGAGVLLITLVYGHLAARLPVTGYAYQWASRIVSPHYGWFTGWNALLCTLVGSAGISVSLASVFAPDIWSNPTHWDVALLAVAGIVVAVTINVLSIKAAGLVNNTGASLELFGTLGATLLLGIGLFFFHHVQGPHVLVQSGSSTGAGVGFSTIGLALLLPVWTLAGWEGSADLAEETSDPRRTAPRAMLRAVVVSGVAAFVVYAVFAMAIRGPIAHTVNGTANPMVAIFSDHFGGIGSDLLQIVAFVAMLSCLLANITCATRTGFSLARDRMLPFSRVWSSVNGATATPVYTIIAVGVFAITINLLSGGFVSNVLAVVNVALYLTYGSTCVAVLIAHRRGTIPQAPPGFFGLGRWLVPVAATCVVFAVAVVVFMVGPASSHTVLWYAVCFEAAGLVWYLTAVRGRLRRGEAGPATPQSEA